MQPIYLDTPEYIVEVWDINNVFVADISRYIATSLRYTFSINDIEEISFAIDLVQFEKLCADIGARPLNIIEPYRTDIKIRRNNEYILGGHVVQTNVNFNSQDTNKLEVQCTGYLNHFKERYMTNEYYGMTYAQIVRQLVTDTQSAYNYVSNRKFEQGISGWEKIDSAYVIWAQGQGEGGSNALYTEITTGPNTYGGARYRTPMQAGVQYTATFKLRAGAAGGTVYVRSETSLPAWSANLTDMLWNTYTVTWTQTNNSDYFDINTTGNINFWIDDVILSDNINNAARRNFGVTLGVDEASLYQNNTRVRNYDLQNVKDAIINLTKLENDNFEFQFDANKVLNIYERLGSDKPEIELVYPQNITSMSVTRDAQTLYNMIQGVGSGIGEERIESVKIDVSSASAYRVRESVQLFNSVSAQSTLDTNTVGTLNEYKDIYDNITINISSNSLDLNEVKLGDAVYVRVDGSSYVDYVNSLYRIVKISVDVSRDMEENVSLQMKKWSI